MSPNRIQRVLRIGLLIAIAGSMLFLGYRFRFVTLTPGCDTMLPDYLNVSKVVVDRLPVMRGTLSRGEVVAYESLMGDRRVRCLAAVGALPGDALRNAASTLWIDGSPSPYAAVRVADEHERVPEGRYLLFHENRDSAFPDSRRFGFVDRRAILGRVGATVPF